MEQMRKPRHSSAHGKSLGKCASSDIHVLCIRIFPDETAVPSLFKLHEVILWMSERPVGKVVNLLPTKRRYFVAAARTK
jgi:hypothetical protein